MAKPFMRVDLSVPGDFAPVILQEGVPVLDKWGTHAALLAKWLGRFAAVVEWDEQTLKCYLLDDDGVRLDHIPCQPATSADLGGSLKQEIKELKSRLAQAAPQSESARLLHQHVSQMLADPRSTGKTGGRRHPLFKYRGLQGDWRLVCCPGYAPTTERASWTPAICQEASCRLLTLVDRSGSRPCPRCGQPVRTRS